LRAARAAGNVRVEPEVIVIASIDDNSWTIVPAVSWIPRRHLQLYLRAVRLAGGSRSVAGAAPFAATVTAGVSARF
jgi:hypothetical protein